MEHLQGSSHTVDANQVLLDEKALISRQRVHRNQHQDASHYSAICISGGGIRSASFALGVLQAINSRKLLSRFDYLSTVSGGGYIGSSWTWFNYLKREKRLPDTGQNPETSTAYFFPFGEPDEGARSNLSSIQNRILSYFRQHASYLVPGFGLNYISAILVVLRNMLLPLMVYISLLILFFTGFYSLEIAVNDIDAFMAMMQGIPAHNMIELTRSGELPARLNLALMLAFASLGGAIFCSLLYAPVTFILSRTSRLAYRARTAFQITTGMLATAAILFGVISLLPVLIREAIHVFTAGAAGALGIIGGIWHFLKQRQPSSIGRYTQVMAILSSLLLIIAILAIAYFFAAQYFSSAWKIALPLSLIFGYVISINQYGIGRMYRDRLMETFLPDVNTIETGQWHPAVDASNTQLSDVCTQDDLGPYHLLNTNLILVDAVDRKFRGRGGDNFILSSLYCGSDATGWISSKDFNSHDLTLPTAMATSGAAANPHAGPNSQGITKNPFVSFLMFVLGLRMGLFVINPMKHDIRGVNVPNYLFPGLYQGLLGLRANRRSRFLDLSDGGHFDNTAIYETIRRRVDVIVCSEAGQDNHFGFGDIANLLEKVRVDFGVHVRFRDEYGLKYLMPGSAESVPSFEKRYDMALRGFAIADIKYPETDGNGMEEAQAAKTGVLFFIKATFVEDLPADLYGYKDANPAFPNQTTMDQFFDEVQVESYRELGYQLAKKMADNEFFLQAINHTPASNKPG